MYAAWETDEIIGYELWRNIGLALAAILAVIVVLLANLRISALVFLTVLLTLVDIVGFLHFWGITVDIISCVNIVLAVGLCVDYSVHIGHAFIVAKGEKMFDQISLKIFDKTYKTICRRPQRAHDLGSVHDRVCGV